MVVLALALLYYRVSQPSEVRGSFKLLLWLCRAVSYVLSKKGHGGVCLLGDVVYLTFP